MHLFTQVFTCSDMFQTYRSIIRPSAKFTKYALVSVITQNVFPSLGIYRVFKKSHNQWRNLIYIFFFIIMPISYNK
jgi:hypothetical protein